VETLIQHQMLLADRARLTALRQAIRETVRVGDVVLDLGAGTGILGFLALQAGASHVYAVERGPVARLARHVARENRLDDRITFVNADVRRARLKERADVLVCDMVSQFGLLPELGGGVVAARRHLKPGARSVPRRYEMWVAPVSDPAFHRRTVRAGSGHGVDFDVLHRLWANGPAAYEGRIRGAQAPFRRAFAFDFLRDPVTSRRARLSFRGQDRPVHGLALLVRVRLSNTVKMDSSQGSHWRPVFLPLYEPVSARALRVELDLDGPSGPEWAVNGQRQNAAFVSDSALRRLNGRRGADAGAGVPPRGT
jgi:SAM-dependent methyltransferase